MIPCVLFVIQSGCKSFPSLPFPPLPFPKDSQVITPVSFGEVIQVTSNMRDGIASLSSRLSSKQVVLYYPTSSPQASSNIVLSSNWEMNTVHILHINNTILRYQAWQELITSFTAPIRNTNKNGQTRAVSHTNYCGLAI